MQMHCNLLNNQSGVMNNSVLIFFNRSAGTDGEIHQKCRYEKQKQQRGNDY